MSPSWVAERDSAFGIWVCLLCALKLFSPVAFPLILITAKQWKVLMILIFQVHGCEVCTAVEFGESRNSRWHRGWFNFSVCTWDSLVIGKLPYKNHKRSALSSVQLLSCVWLLVTPWTAACQASLSITNSWSLLKLMSIESVMPSNHLILCHPLLLLLSIFPNIKVFSNESDLCIRWPKYWSFSFNLSPHNKHPGMISFRMVWLNLLAVQGTLKSLLQHHSSKASILQCSAFFIVQLSHPYTTTGKTIALTRRIFVGKVMSLLFTMLSRLVITFLPRSKRLLISWLQSPSQWFWSPPK